MADEEKKGQEKPKQGIAIVIIKAITSGGTSVLIEEKGKDGKG